jgi:hypothetical protein
MRWAPLPWLALLGLCAPVGAQTHAGSDAERHGGFLKVEPRRSGDKAERRGDAPQRIGPYKIEIEERRAPKSGSGGADPTQAQRGKGIIKGSNGTTAAKTTDADAAQRVKKDETPNRVSTNVSVPKQSQGATFGDRQAQAEGSAQQGRSAAGGPTATNLTIKTKSSPP